MERRNEVSIKLWPYQLRGVNDIHMAFESHHWVLYSLSTGAGKTVIFCHILREWARRSLRVCVVVNSRHLVDQTSAALGDIPHGIIRGGVKAQPEFGVQIATIQALIARPDENHFDAYVVDEAHHAAAASYQKALKGAKRVLGLTATPFRKDGIGLGSAGFTALIQGPGIADLTPEYLSEAELYGPPSDSPTVDLRGIKKQMGDFPASNELAARVNQKTITGNAVEHYKKRAAGRRALVYCVTRKHARDVAKEFGLAGIPTAYLDGTMIDTERRAVLDALRIGKVLVVVSCELIGEGLDVPAVGCVILLRPTQSLRVLMQHVGRGLRRSDDGAVVVLDHVGNFARNDWFPTDSLEFALEDRCQRARASRLQSLRQCSSCGRLSGDGSPTCGACGRKAVEPVRVDGQLARIEAPFRLYGKANTGFICRIRVGENVYTAPLPKHYFQANEIVKGANARYAKTGELPKSEDEFRMDMGVKRKLYERELSLCKKRNGNYLVSKRIGGKRVSVHFGKDLPGAQEAVDRANRLYLQRGKWPDTAPEFREWLGSGPTKVEKPLSLFLRKDGGYMVTKKIGESRCAVCLGRDRAMSQRLVDKANRLYFEHGEWPDSEDVFRAWLGQGNKQPGKAKAWNETNYTS